MNYHNFILPENLGLLRVDKAISMMLIDYSRVQIQRAIEQGYLKINAQVVTTPHFKVKALDNIEITLNIIEELEQTLAPAKIDFEVIYEDEDIIVINKPANLTVHPGPGNIENTLVNGLLYYYANTLSNVNNQRPGIVHRLDKDTSGVMLVAKNNQAHFLLAKQIENHQVKREYKALVWGRINPLSGTIESNIKRSKLNRMKMTITQDGGKHAITHYATEEIFGNVASLINCRLQTGRTHQIRVHLSSIGHSLIGDQTYGKNARKIKNLPQALHQVCEHFLRQALHSYHIAFIHPISKKPLEFTTPLPDDFQTLYNLFKIAY